MGVWALLLKLFVPAWRFFDGVEAIYVLEYRFCSEKALWSDWQRIESQEKRHAISIFYSARSNLRLAINSAIERCLNRSTGDDIDLDPSKKTFRRLERLVGFWMGFQHPTQAFSEYQFRLLHIENGASQEIFVSKSCGEFL